MLEIVLDHLTVAIIRFRKCLSISAAHFRISAFPHVPNASMSEGRETSVNDEIA